jgi:hypothetical protein
MILEKLISSMLQLLRIKIYTKLLISPKEKTCYSEKQI